MRSQICRGAHYVQVLVTDRLKRSPAPSLWTVAHFSPHLTHIAQQHCNWWIVQHYIKWRSSRGSPHFVYFPSRIFFLPSYWSELMSCCCWDPVVRWTYFLSLFMFSNSYGWGTTWRSERPSLRRARTTNSSWRTKYTTSRRDCTTCRRHTPSRSE